jgi:hypothetical protein
VRCTAVAEVVAVVDLLCEIQSTILRNLGVVDIAFRDNCICQEKFSLATRLKSHGLSGSLHKLNFIITNHYVRRAGLLYPPIGSTNRRGGVA